MGTIKRRQAAIVRRLATDMKMSKAKLREVTQTQQLDSIRHNENVSLLYKFITTAPELLKSDIAKLEGAIQEK
jgi:predicted transcriptional regulator